MTQSVKKEKHIPDEMVVDKTLNMDVDVDVDCSKDIGDYTVKIDQNEEEKCIPFKK